MTEKVANTGKDQERIDEVYGEVMVLMKKCLKEEKWTATKDRRHQPWFSKENARLRNSSIRQKRNG